MVTVSVDRPNAIGVSSINLVMTIVCLVCLQSANQTVGLVLVRFSQNNWYFHQSPVDVKLIPAHLSKSANFLIYEKANYKRACFVVYE